MPPHSVLVGEPRVKTICLALGLSGFMAASIVGCAKFPSGGGGTGGKRLVFSVTLDREINSNFVYIVAIRPSTDSNPPEQGPIPVIAPPWGNGFVAGTNRYFVRYDPTQSPRYQIYQFQDANYLNYVPIGVPINFVDPNPGDRVLRFELDLNQLALTQTEADSYQSIQVNLLTMDTVPQGSTGSKKWDALGDGRLPSEINTPITISVRTGGTYSNTTFSNLEPRGDVVDPDLDIVDWQIEVRLN